MARAVIRRSPTVVYRVYRENTTGVTPQPREVHAVSTADLEWAVDLQEQADTLQWLLERVVTGQQGDIFGYREGDIAVLTRGLSPDEIVRRLLTVFDFAEAHELAGALYQAVDQITGEPCHHDTPPIDAYGGKLRCTRCNVIVRNEEDQ